MRVTDLTKHNAVVRHMNQASEQVGTLQENMSSGKRINKLSDDPIGGFGSKRNSSPVGKT